MDGSQNGQKGSRQQHFNILENLENGDSTGRGGTRGAGEVELEVDGRSNEGADIFDSLSKRIDNRKHQLETQNKVRYASYTQQSKREQTAPSA